LLAGYRQPTNNLFPWFQINLGTAMILFQLYGISLSDAADRRFRETSRFPDLIRDVEPSRLGLN